MNQNNNLSVCPISYIVPHLPRKNNTYPACRANKSKEALKKYNRFFDEHREKIRAVKRGLTVKSNSDDIDRYNRMRFDTCQDLQDLAKQLKTKIGQNT